MNFSIKYFSLCLTILSVLSLSATTYEELKNEFKRELFLRQKGLMSASDYYTFIDPFIQEAEQELEAINYCQKYPDSKWAAHYFSHLSNYNTACFHAITKPNAPFVLAYPRLMTNAERFDLFWPESLKALLSHLISPQLAENNGSVIKFELGEQLENLDIKAELEKTRALLLRANKQYVKKLGLVK